MTTISLPTQNTTALYQSLASTNLELTSVLENCDYNPINIFCELGDVYRQYSIRPITLTSLFVKLCHTIVVEFNIFNLMFGSTHNGGGISPITKTLSTSLLVGETSRYMCYKFPTSFRIANNWEPLYQGTTLKKPIKGSNSTTYNNFYKIWDAAQSIFLNIEKILICREGKELNDQNKPVLNSLQTIKENGIKWDTTYTYDNDKKIPSGGSITINPKILKSHMKKIMDHIDLEETTVSSAKKEFDHFLSQIGSGATFTLNLHEG